jgi:hypothetical protein
MPKQRRRPHQSGLRLFRSRYLDFFSLANRQARRAGRRSAILVGAPATIPYARLQDFLTRDPIGGPPSGHLERFGHALE